MANLAAECKSKDISINMEYFYIWLCDKYKPDDIYLFIGYLEKYKDEYKENEVIGYKYIFKEAVYNKDEKKIKANCDVDIAIHGTLDKTEKDLEFAVLVTSDGDFASLVKFWQSREVIVRIVSPADPSRCSYLLKRIAPVTYLIQIVGKIINEKALNEDKTSPRPFS